MISAKGRIACQGAACAKAFEIKAPQKAQSTSDAYLSVDEELERLENGLARAKEELEALYQKALTDLGEEQAQIFEMQGMMLDDPDLADGMRDLVKKGAISASKAALLVGEEQARAFEALDDPYMKERALDVRDVSQRVSRAVEGASNVTISEPCIIVADDLTPSQTVAFDRKFILGMILRHGAMNSHAAILARTMNIPTLIGAQLPESGTLDGKMIALDAVHGVFYAEPTDEIISEVQTLKDNFHVRRLRLLGLRGKASITPQGHVIKTYANIGRPDDVEMVLENDAEGIGLFRSEFLFLERDDFPSENEQYKAYSKVAQALNGKLVVIRTLDIGADKQAHYFNLPHEENPALGMRAIRICLTRPQIFKTQLRAIFRASACGNVAMMFPMITCPEEVLDCLKICDEVEEELKAENIAEDCISVTEYKEDNNFIKITPKDSARHYIVSLITEMFNKGFVNVLVGTQALLGEGWDAPSINSLILSSTVSSYMLSNQMRGRAIRIDKNNPDKVSNIWHLASIQIPKLEDITDNNIFAPTVTSNEMDSLNAGLYDLMQLGKRFEGFEAPSYFYNHEIVNGIDRVFSLKEFQMLNTLGEKRLFQNLNGKIMSLAKNREQTKQWWQKSLNLGYNNSYMRLRTGVDVARLTAKTLCYSGYKAILFSIIGILFAVFYFLIEFSVMVAFIVFIIGTLLAFIYVAYHYLRTGTVESIIKQIAIVHLETLSYLGYINTSLKKVGIHVDSTELSVFVDCENLPTEENNLLINSMKEFLDPIENPRYVLIKKDKFAKFINQTDYFAIPAIFSSKKKDVQVFEKLWMKYIGPCECVYTRNLEGRKILLKARNLAFSSLKRNKSKKLSKWQ